MGVKTIPSLQCLVNATGEVAKHLIFKRCLKKYILPIFRYDLETDTWNEVGQLQKKRAEVGHVLMVWQTKKFEGRIIFLL